MNLFTVLTGHTCGDHCWHARELVCRCSCGGANHGIMLRGGTRPQRTRKIGGNFYELVSIVATDEGQTGCQANAMVKAELELKRVTNERFPGLTWMGYGSWRPEAHKPVLDMAITESQANWEEVKAVPNAVRLIWARPVGTKYLTLDQSNKIAYTTFEPNEPSKEVVETVV